MATKFYLVDDTTEATALSFGPTAAGATSAAQVLHFWFNKGTPGGSIANLWFQAVDPATDLDSGVDWLDETWLEARINGGDNPDADPAFVPQTTAWQKLGAGLTLPALDLPGNCALYLEVRLHPPLKEGTPTESAIPFKIRANYSESVMSLAGALADLGAGIITGVGDRTVTEWVEAPVVTATGTPDAVVHVPKRWWVQAGLSVRTYAADALTLNQNDGAAAALVTGEEYLAVISQPVSVGNGDVASVATKGLKAVAGSSITPALPAGNLLIAVAKVSYHAGASVINTSDITNYAASGRGKPTIGTGLNVNVAALRAIMPGARIINHSARVVAVPASLTNYIWLGSSDTFTVNQSTTPPFTGALLICKAVTNGSVVTTLTDLRAYFEPAARTLTLHKPFGEPRFFSAIRVARSTFTINNSAFTDCTFLSGDVLVLAVAGYWKVQPTSSTTADIGVSGTTQRYAAGVSTVAGQTFNGLIDGPRYYTSAPVIRVTPNAISANNGLLELTLVYIDVRQSSAAYVDSIAASEPWNLDRIVATMIGGGGGTGTTTFDVKRMSDGTSLCPSGGRPSIASPATVPSDTSAWPNVTVGLQDTFGLYLSEVADPGDFYYNYDVQCDLVLYPIVLPT